MNNIVQSSTASLDWRSILRCQYPLHGASPMRISLKRLEELRQHRLELEELAASSQHLQNPATHSYTMSRKEITTIILRIAKSLKAWEDRLLQGKYY